MDVFVALGIIILLLWFVCSTKNLKFTNDKKDGKLCEYYLKYRLSDDDDYKIAYSDEFEDISKITSDFLLVDFNNHNTLDKDESMSILNSENSDIMLGVGDWVQVWYFKP